MRFPGLGGLLLALTSGLMLSTCDRSGDLPLPFAGAVSVPLQSFDRGLPPSEQEVERLIEALIDAYGGRDRWESQCFVLVQDLSMRHTGDIMSNRAVKTVWCRPDDTYRAQERHRSGLAQRLMSSAGTFIALRGLEMSPTRAGNEVFLDYEYEVLRLPAGLAEPGVKITASAPQEFEGHRLLPLTVDDGREPTIQVYVDPIGPVIRRVEARVPVAAQVSSGAAKLDLAVTFSDFVFDEDRLLVAGRVDHWSDGKHMSIADLVERKWSAWIDDAVFVPSWVADEDAR